MSPGNNESAGKRPSAKTLKVDPWLQEPLVEAARVTGRMKGTCLSAQDHCLVRRRAQK